MAGREGGRHMESSTNLYTHHVQNRELVGSSSVIRELSLVLCDDLEVWGGGGEGRRLKRKETDVNIQLIPIVVEQKLTQYCKAMILQ